MIRHSLVRGLRFGEDRIGSSLCWMSRPTVGMTDNHWPKPNSQRWLKPPQPGKQWAASLGRTGPCSASSLPTPG